MQHVRKAVEERLEKLLHWEESIKASINHLENELKEEVKQLSLILEEKDQLAIFLNGEGNEG